MASSSSCCIASPLARQTVTRRTDVIPGILLGKILGADRLIGNVGILESLALENVVITHDGALLVHDVLHSTAAAAEYSVARIGMRDHLRALGICGAEREDRLEVVRFDNNTETVIAHVQERCVNRPNGYPFDAIDVYSDANGPTALIFDPIRGRLLISKENDCVGDQLAPCAYGFGRRVIALSGFTTILDILQTYTPDPPQLGFRVPYMPEGLAGADWFDTYYGSVTKPLDLAQAQPLQCGYPATAPETGDYLTVADTVPDPAPGSAVYYLTAATFQGETRAGRKRDETGLSGRDPSVSAGVLGDRKVMADQAVTPGPVTLVPTLFSTE